MEKNGIEPTLGAADTPMTIALLSLDIADCTNRVRRLNCSWEKLHSAATQPEIPSLGPAVKGEILNECRPDGDVKDSRQQLVSRGINETYRIRLCELAVCRT